MLFKGIGAKTRVGQFLSQARRACGPRIIQSEIARTIEAIRKGVSSGLTFHGPSPRRCEAKTKEKAGFGTLQEPKEESL